MHTMLSALLAFARAVQIPKARLVAENAALRQQLAAASGPPVLPNGPVTDIRGPRTSPVSTLKRELGAQLVATADGGLEVSGSTLWLIGSGGGSDNNKLVVFTLK